MKLKMYINNQPISQYKTEICLTSLYKPPTSYKFKKNIIVHTEFEEH